MEEDFDYFNINVILDASLPTISEEVIFHMIRSLEMEAWSSSILSPVMFDITWI